MEFSIDKMRQVGSVAILGGLIEIVLFILCSAMGSMMIGGALSEGIFVGALVSMSSTSVVVKTLGDRANSSVSQIVIGTLILQDCSVGLMFALMPVLSSLNDPSSGLDPEATGEIVLLILKVRLSLLNSLAVLLCCYLGYLQGCIFRERVRGSSMLHCAPVKQACYCSCLRAVAASL